MNTEGPPPGTDQDTPSTPREEKERQEEIDRRLYIEQIRRRSCPGCGEGFEIF